MPCVRLAPLALVGLFTGLVGGCGADDSSAPNRLTVLAASSLTSPFTEKGHMPATALRCAVVMLNEPLSMAMAVGIF